MGLRFRQFINATPFRLGEGAEAAPSMGGPPAPPSTPGQGDDNSHHPDMIKGQLGMEDEDYDTAMEDQSITVWLPQDRARQWGLQVAGSTQVTVKNRPDGNYDVTFQLSDKKTMLPKSFIFPYKKGEQPIAYKGPVEDKTVTMTPEELTDITTVPFQKKYFQPPQGGMGGPGGPGGGMGGGGPMGGGGAPPPGGGGGAPPPGGP
jgi:hypothetical protein